MRFTIYCSLLFLLLSWKLQAQLQRPNIEVLRMDSSAYLYPWAGALNNPEFSEIDIDGDGIKDLFIFDKDGDKVLTFKNNGSPNTVDYTYMPEWQALFPDSLGYFAILRDYNCDGIEDIFSFYQNPQTGAAGIMVHRASRGAGNLLNFSLASRGLQYNDIGQSNRNNIFLTLIDLPAIDDIDGDGDLDVLAFENGAGYLQWYSNQQVELGLSCDSLRFERVDDCWGRFYESGLGPNPFLSPNVDSCHSKQNWSPLRLNSGAHAGTTLLTLDANNDQRKELVLGNISYSNLNLLYNNGVADTAFVDTLDPNFPSNSLSVDLDFFPAAFYLDINNDNKKDFIAAPNNYNLSVNDKVAWLYLNSGTTNAPNLSYEQNNFMVEEMIELGSTAAPAFVDFNQDGLMDLVVGTYGLFVNSSTYRTKLVAYENIGTPTQPRFRVYSEDFASLQQYNLRRLVPTFGDLDDDGDADLILGEENGQLLYLMNTSTGATPSFSTPLPFYASIDVGQHSVPQLIDVDRDGDLDLLIGERNGNLNYYENTGTPVSASFSDQPTSFSFGLIDTRLPGALEGSSAPRLWDHNGSYLAFVGTESGEVWTYNSIEGNLSGAFQRISSDFDQIDEGRQSIPAIADITNDGQPEIVVGNKRGGLAIFSSDLISANTKPIPSIALLKIYPNPAAKGIFLSTENVIIKDIKLQIIDVLGRSVETLKIDPNNSPVYIDLEMLDNGVYFITGLINHQPFTHKIILQK